MTWSLKTAGAVALIAFAGASARADLITGSATADNHYALYSASGSTFTFHGGNELGASGSQGGYNWSNAESWEFAAGDSVYIATWSDGQVAQGLLAEFHSVSLGTILSGDARWQVYDTSAPMGDGDAYPDASEIAGFVSLADATNAWQTPYMGGANGMGPWGFIDGVSADAQWMWGNSVGADDPLTASNAGDNLLIFRTAVPAPGAASIAAGALLLMSRRRR